MGYDKEIIAKAFSVKEEECEKARAAYYAALKKAKENSPRLVRIEQELSQIGAQILLLGLSGDQAGLKAAQKNSEALASEKRGILQKAGLSEKPILCRKCQDTGRCNNRLCTCITEIAKQLTLAQCEKFMPLSECGFDRFSLAYYPPECQKKMEKNLEFCRRYAEQFSPLSTNILMLGKSGLGKTFLSLAITRTVIDAGYGVIYGSAQDLFRKAENEHFSFGGTSPELDRLLSCDLLVIDDLGTELKTAFNTSLLYNIVNTRLLQKRPTVINTNLTFAELEERYSARITSRFVGEYEMRSFVGTDIRQQKAMERLKKDS